MDFNNWNDKFAGLYSFIDSLREQLKPYVEVINIIEQNAKKVVLDFAEKAKPILAFQILAEHQFTYWKFLHRDEVEKIIAAHDVNECLAEWIEGKAFIDYDILCEEMVHSMFLSKTNKSILLQAFKAMNAGLYDLTLVGVVTVFDGVLSATTNDVSTNLSKRLSDIRNRLESLSDEELEALDESEITAFGMYIIWTKTMDSFQAYSKFSKPETEPQGLNRHWIAHGRKTTVATKLDCCKMINALYGLFYFGSPFLEIF